MVQVAGSGEGEAAVLPASVPQKATMFVEAADMRSEVQRLLREALGGHPGGMYLTSHLYRTVVQVGRPTLLICTALSSAWRVVFAAIATLRDVGRRLEVEQFRAFFKMLIETGCRGTADDSLCGTADGILSGTADGILSGTADGSLSGTADGNSSGAADCSLSGTTVGDRRCRADGSLRDTYGVGA